MPAAHFAHWPPGLPHRLALPERHLAAQLADAAALSPDKPCIVFHDNPLSYREFVGQVERLAGFLQHDCGVRAGDRVLLDLQNSPQWALACFAILRADAVVVPVNPMYRSAELHHVATDSGARVAFVAQDLLAEALPLLRPDGGAPAALQQLVVATYSDLLPGPSASPVPEAIAAPRDVPDLPGVTNWADALGRAREPGPLTAGPDDLAVMPYTSGTTGVPRGCMHTHRSMTAALVAGVRWFGRGADDVFLSTLPYFHVTGLTGSLCGPLTAGATVVMLSRWDRDAAALAIGRYRVSCWQAISTMVIDFLASPTLDQAHLSSLRVLRGGGAAMPAAVAALLERRTGLHYVEGYGMSETMAATHINPPQRPKAQCLGIPLFDVDARIVDPVTLAALPAGETGEIVVRAPQLMQGYWNNPAATAAVFVDLDGQRFLRTGDLAQVDSDGYYFMVDRLKRMINASGYKVWPAEVESALYHHPAVLEACVIGAADPRRGETVKALVVLRPEFASRTTEQEIIDWARGQMAVYKSPRIVEFVPALQRSGTGKVMWRELQEQQNRRDAAETS